MQAHYRFLRKGQWSSCRRTWPCWRECRRPAFPPDWGSHSAAPGSNMGRTQRRTGCHSQLPLRWLKEHSDIMCIMLPTVTITMAETTQWHHVHYTTYSHHNGWNSDIICIMPPTVTITMAERTHWHHVHYATDSHHYNGWNSDIICIMPPTVTITMAERTQWYHVHYATYSHHNGWNSDIICITPPTVTITMAERTQWHHVHYATYSHHNQTMAETVTSYALHHLQSPLQWLKEHTDIMCITPPTAIIAMAQNSDVMCITPTIVIITVAKTQWICALNHL